MNEINSSGMGDRRASRGRWGYAATGLLAALAAFAAAESTAEAQAVITDSGCMANVTPPNDDGNFGPVPLGFGVEFGGAFYSQVYIDNNGYVSFKAPPTRWWRIKDWESWNTPLIAPFLADADTSGPDSSVVTYGQITYGGKSALCINWVDVGYFASNSDKLNSFQLLLVQRDDLSLGGFEIVMNYDRLLWEAGDDTGAVGGVGGTFPPRAGFYDGVGNSFELPGSLSISALLDSSPTGLVHGYQNSATPGTYRYEITGGVPPTETVVAGTIYDPNNNPLANAPVQVCCKGGFPICVNATTNDQGDYIAKGFNSTALFNCNAFNNEWVILVNPPSGAEFLPVTSTPFILKKNDIVTNIDAILGAPAGMPAGTTFEPSSTGGMGLPTIYWKSPTTLTTNGCAGGTATYTISQDGENLLDTPAAMSELSPGYYAVDLPALYPNHGYITITLELACPDGSSGSYSFDAYIDPSGWVRDIHGAPVVGATATLLRSDNPYGPFTPVPDGSAIMSPSNRSNPSYTDAEGHFGWDTISGYYIVRAEKEGCVSAVDPEQSYVQTDVLPVPPEWLDLELILNCDGTTPPEIMTPGNLVVEASGLDGATVEYEVSAIDDVDGPVPVFCSPASGSLFPVGTTTVTCGAVDAVGNADTKSFDVSVVYGWTGVLGPADDGGVFKLGRSVPVKFQLGGESSWLEGVEAYLFIAPVVGGGVGAEVPATSAGGSNQGNAFRYDATSGQYSFNLSTKGLSAGEYQLRIDLGDGEPRTMSISLVP